MKQRVLKELREKAKLTQHQLADVLGVGTQFVSNIERKLCPVPPKHMRKWSKAIRCPLNQLIEYNTARYIDRLKRNLR